MSRVTNAILAYSLGEDRSDDDEGFVQLAAVNKFFGDNLIGFVSVEDPKLPTSWYGGTKMLEVHLAIGAFNYLDLEGLVTHIQSLTWEEPGDVQLLIREEESDTFKIVRPMPEPWQEDYTVARFAQDGAE